MFRSFESGLKRYFAGRERLLKWSIWFFLGNTLFFWLIGLRYLYIFVVGNFNPAAPSGLSQVFFLDKVILCIFMMLAFIGHFALLAFIPALLVILAILLWPRRWLVFTLGILLLSLSVNLLIVDSTVFAQYRFHLFNNFIFHMVFSKDAQEIFDFSWLEWVTIICLCGIIILIETIYAYYSWKKLSLKSINSLIIALVIIGSALLLSYQIFIFSIPTVYLLAEFMGISFVLLAYWYICRVYQQPFQIEGQKYALVLVQLVVIYLLIGLFEFVVLKLPYSLLIISKAITLGLLIWFAINLIPRREDFPYKVRLSLFGFIIYQIFIFGVNPATWVIPEAGQSLPLYNETLSSWPRLRVGLKEVNNLSTVVMLHPNLDNHKLHYPLQTLQCTPPPKPLNVIIIGIDTWRFDMLNAQVMPNVTKFAQTAWQFNNHWSGGNSTQPGVFSLFYGLPNNYWTSMLLQHQGPVLMQEFIKQGYQMGIFASAELTTPALNKTVFADIKDLTVRTPGANPTERDQIITDKFNHFLTTVPKQKPFFVFLFYDTAHSFCYPGNPVNKFEPSIKVCNRILNASFSDAAGPTPYLNRYKNALYMIDSLIGKDFAEMAKRGLMKNTVVIITGDHGNEFNDNHLGYWGHSSNFTRFQAQTPLVIYWPGATAQLFNQQTSHYDIAPTLLTKVLGCHTDPSQYSLGRVLPVKDNDITYLIIGSYINYGILEKDRITTVSPNGGFDVTDLKNRPLVGATPHMEIIKQVFKDIKQFYYDS